MGKALSIARVVGNGRLVSTSQLARVNWPAAGKIESAPDSESAMRSQDRGEYQDWPPSCSSSKRTLIQNWPISRGRDGGFVMSEDFFPNQSPEAMQIEMRFRREVEKLPEASRLILYEVLSLCYPTFVPTIFVADSSMTLARQCGCEIAFPSPIPMVKLSHVLFGYEEWLSRKYCLPGFVEVEPGDIVIDCGAYVGGFSLGAARLAKEVHAFEPEAANFACMVRNHGTRENVRCNSVGLFCDSKTTSLNISASSVEHSLLMPDDGPPIEVREIQVLTLMDYCVTTNIDKLDFVKIEAEGVELEVFDGLGTIRPRKLAIDVSPERNGESPADEFRRRLDACGYSVRQRGHVMFAVDERR